VGRRLPRRPLAVFEANGGRTFDGNARQLSDALRRAQPSVVQAWVVRGEPERAPEHAMAVERGTLRSHWLRSRARYWIDDGTSDEVVVKPAGTLSVFAGRGVPVHRLGLDDPSVLVSRSATATVRRRARRWDLLVATSSFDADVSRSALGYGGSVVESGLPRMDGALASRRGDAVDRAAARRRLDLPQDRPIILYAPTGRRMDRRAAEPLLDLERWADALRSRAYLLLRPHPLDLVPIPTRLRGAVRDLAGVDNLADFLAVSDMFVSDYSSLVGDAALADLSIVLYQPDREMYVNRTRGLYSGLDVVGPLAVTTAALVDEVGSWLDDPVGWEARHAVGRRAWAEERCGPNDGGATERALDAMLGVGHDR
jgi:CDP-glycerol glycerophosphotransferase